ncbi:MAG: helix-turn-helix transcriptional regulator [Ktedonobacteraceae bacterium]
MRLRGTTNLSTLSLLKLNEVHWVSTLRLQFGRNLRRLRKQRNITQERLAETANLSVEQISFIERGISGASFDSLPRLAEALNVSVKDLFTSEQET